MHLKMLKEANAAFNAPNCGYMHVCCCNLDNTVSCEVLPGLLMQIGQQYEEHGVVAPLHTMQ